MSQTLIGSANLKRLISSIYQTQKEIVNFIKEHRTIKVLHVFRNYSSLIVVVSSALLVSATNLAAGHESSGFLFGYFGNSDNYESPLKDRIFLNAGHKTSLALAPLAEAKGLPDPNFKDSESDDKTVFMQGQALVSNNSPVLKDPEEDGGVIIYEVQEGDTIGSIAAANHISQNTILWANEIDDINSIMPGDKIFILPINGLSHTVKNGDDIDSIAKEYKADKERIIALNSLPADGKLKEGQEIMIPDGQKEIPKPAPTTAPSANSDSSFGIASRPYESFSTPGKSTLSGKAGAGHSFPYGYCTWYVASKRYVPWSGNAGTWLYRAKSAGYATSKTPSVGAIMVTSESWWGHVAIVEKVSGSTITVSEMNYKGWAKRSTRTLDAKSRVIKGFIK